MLKDSTQEQVILWDVTRTFPAHEHFKEANGPGQNGLYNISKVRVYFHLGSSLLESNNFCCNVMIFEKGSF